MDADFPQGMACRAASLQEKDLRIAIGSIPVSMSLSTESVRKNKAQSKRETRTRTPCHLDSYNRLAPATGSSGLDTSREVTDISELARYFLKITYFG
jgi:hypothetical protein